MNALKRLIESLKPWREVKPPSLHDFRDPSWKDPYERRPDMGGREVKPLRNNVIQFGGRVQ